MQATETGISTSPFSGVNQIHFATQTGFDAGAIPTIVRIPCHKGFVSNECNEKGNREMSSTNSYTHSVPPIGMPLSHRPD